MQSACSGGIGMRGLSCGAQTLGHKPWADIAADAECACCGRMNCAAKKFSFFSSWCACAPTKWFFSAMGGNKGKNFAILLSKRYKKEKKKFHKQRKPTFRLFTEKRTLTFEKKRNTFMLAS
eukprot:m.112552 g.112552  ORF g.112552 m.112552 type:complete len:121 (-) comp19283_c0_seq1:120-482(-)